MKYLLAALFWIHLASGAFATDLVRGMMESFRSYNGVTEHCVRIAHIPGGTYAKGDLKDEVALCELDFYAPDIALCPKTWATSAAIVIYDISEGQFANNRLDFQRKVCGGGQVAKYIAHDKPARMKFTMNQADTSATNSPASLLYYHFSRYFGFESKVPVAVWRSIDRQVLRGEVVLGGVALTTENAILSANNAAWRHLLSTIDDPASYEQPDGFGSAADLISGNGRTFFGVMYDGGGDSYGPEINGVGDPTQPVSEKYLGFAETPAMQALFADTPLVEAIAQGLTAGSAALAAAGLTPEDISAAQMAFWMREISEVLLIDHIMAQQDRVGNLDSRAYYYWLAEGDVQRKRARDLKPGDDGIPAEAVRITRTRLNDNDAAGRVEYDNHTQLAGLLARLRHFDAGVYQRLLELDADLQSQGDAHRWLASSLGLQPFEAQMVVDNTAEAAGILQAACIAGQLRFDLDPQAFLAAGTVAPAQQPCTLQ